MDQVEIICRKDDLRQRLYFRSDRFFTVEKQWYFMSRENPSVGPYSSQRQAAEALESFIKRMNSPANIPQVKKESRDTRASRVNTEIEWMG